MRKQKNGTPPLPEGSVEELIVAATKQKIQRKLEQELLEIDSRIEGIVVRSLEAMIYSSLGIDGSWGRIEIKREHPAISSRIAEQIPRLLDRIDLDKVVDRIVVSAIERLRESCRENMSYMLHDAIRAKIQERVNERVDEMIDGLEAEITGEISASFLASDDSSPQRRQQPDLETDEAVLASLRDPQK